MILGETHEQTDDAVIKIEEVLYDVHKFDAARDVQLRLLGVLTNITVLTHCYDALQ
jgi:hypothetical protein